jgi:hypothetical protein
MGDLEQRDPHDAALQRSDPLQLPPLRVVRDHGVQLIAVKLRALGDLAGERPGPGEQLVEGAARHLTLVGGEHRVAALV